MKIAPLHYVEVTQAHPDAAPGIYAHVLEAAAWLRDSDFEGAAASLETFAAEARAALDA